MLIFSCHCFVLGSCFEYKNESLICLSHSIWFPSIVPYSMQNYEHAMCWNLGSKKLQRKYCSSLVYSPCLKSTWELLKMDRTWGEKRPRSDLKLGTSTLTSKWRWVSSPPIHELRPRREPVGVTMVCSLPVSSYW